MSTGLLQFISNNHLTLMACFAAAAGLCLFLLGFQLFARKQSLGHISSSTVLNAASGLTAISGMAVGPHTLSAPITGRSCYLYQTTAWQQSESGRKRKWEKVAEEILHLPFFVEDATGQLLVEPLGAELDLDQDFRQEYGLPSTSLKPENIPPRVSAFLARNGIAPNRPTRVEERSLQPDTPVFIAGTLTENPGIQVRPYSPRANGSQGNGYRGTIASPAEPASRHEIIRLSSGPAPASTKEMTQQGKIAAALSRAGITNPEAWDVDRVSSQSITSACIAIMGRPQPDEDSAPEASAAPANGRTNGQTQPGAGSGFNPAPPLVLMKGTDSALFAISCHRQPELASSLGWKSVAMVVGGAGLTVLGLCVLFLEWQLQ